MYINTRDILDDRLGSRIYTEMLSLDSLVSDRRIIQIIKPSPHFLTSHWF